jgi:sulfur-oxidizing protein SoxA
MQWRPIAVVLAFGLVAGAGGAANAQSDGKLATYTVGDLRSGYTYATPATQAIQDDDFANPAFLWVDYGETLWEDVSGEAGKACSSCHGDAEDSMKGVGARYPVYSAELGKPISLEQRINKCRVENMQAEPWKWESRELLGATTYVRHQSRGMPVQVQIDGPMTPFYEKGRAFYFQRRGLLDMACSNCHVDNPGNMIRANLLTQGQSNGFPLYRLKWNGVGSIHRRFRGCNKQVRATPYGYGSDEYVNLELFVAGRGLGLPVETPAVRN